MFYHPIQIGSLSLDGNLFLAPVAGYTDRAFRSICIEQGADFTFTELVSSEALARNPHLYGAENSKTNILRRADNEARYCVQLFGANPDAMFKAAALLEAWRPSAVDVNAGCPVPKVTKTGAGAALMKTPGLLGRIVESVVRASEQFLGGVPVTVKIRSGWDLDSLSYATAAIAAVEAGAAMVSLHSRTRAQVYTGKSDWSLIADLVSRIRVPVVGSGDLYSAHDAERMFRETGCAALMFARGALGNPFIFAETRALLTGLPWVRPSVAERLETCFRQLMLLTRDAGEKIACREMRKQFCAYTRGIERGAEMRNRLTHAETIDDYREILDWILTGESGIGGANGEGRSDSEGAEEAGGGDTG
ncbi:MAG: tRNA dihydrouridine synthase DusB [Treponema sp.]|jgi:nifR3 family TIM-barrel protein|nr:tRNA dihydrouridine synthase DusB [Treponema sp.]